MLRTLHSHPACSAALGLCPLAAKSMTLLSAVTVSLMFAVILLLSLISVCSLRKLVSHNYRLVFILLVTSFWTTVVDLLSQACFYEMRITIDIYLPLIAMNSLLLMLLETRALREPVENIINAVAWSVPVVVVLLVSVGLLREVLTYGALFTDSTMLLPTMSLSVAMLPDSIVFPLFGSVAGGFIVLGCVLAMINLLSPAVVSVSGDSR